MHYPLLTSWNIYIYIWCELILKDQQIEEVIWVEHFLSAETTTKHVWSSYYAEKLVLIPKPQIVLFLH